MKTIPERCVILQEQATKAGSSMNLILKAAGVNWTTWRRWASGESQPRVYHWESVLEAFENATGLTMNEAIRKSEEDQR